jgi:hypothetical protein
VSNSIKYEVKVQPNHVSNLIPFFTRLCVLTRVLLAAKPTNMTEEKSTFGVDGVGVCFGVLVVDAVVTGPIVHRVWGRDRGAEGEEHAEWELCFVSSVGPETVDSSGNTEQA